MLYLITANYIAQCMKALLIVNCPCTSFEVDIFKEPFKEWLSFSTMLTMYGCIKVCLHEQ
jgi:hypothetical protein